MSLAGRFAAFLAIGAISTYAGAMFVLAARRFEHDYERDPESVLGTPRGARIDRFSGRLFLKFGIVMMIGSLMGLGVIGVNNLLD